MDKMEIYSDEKNSKKESNVIHFIVEDEELNSINNSKTPIKFTIIPDNSAKIITKEINFEMTTKPVSFDLQYSEDGESTFLFAFFEPSGELVKDIRYGYGIKNPVGDKIVNTGSNQRLLGIQLPSGVDTREISTEMNGNYSMQVVLLGMGHQNFDKFMFKEFNFELSKTETEIVSNMNESADILSNQNTPIPDWIKNNTGWWTEDAIEDGSFIQGI